MSRGPQRIILALSLASTAALPAALAQEPRAESAGATAPAETFAQQLLRAGEKEMRDLRYPEAIAYLSEALKLAEASPHPADRALTPGILELRAVAHLSLGDTPNGERDFSALVELNPSHELDRDQLSPKIMAVFDRVRQQSSALLAFRCDPPDCSVRLGAGAAPLQGPLGERRVRPGRYEVLIERQGFDSLREIWDLRTGQRFERAVALVPNSQSFQVQTIPPGATVLLDGVAVGTTQGPAPPEFEARARAAGVTLADLSAPFLVPWVPNGRHELRIERECHQTARFALEVKPEVRSAAPISFKPVRLKSEQSTLEVQGAPAGGEVRLDGTLVGKLPLQRQGVCAGSHRMEVVFPTGGRWFERVELPAGGVHRVTVRPRPTLAYLGLVQIGAEVGADGRRVEAQLGEHLARLREVNVERRDGDEKARRAWAAVAAAAPIETADGDRDLLSERLGTWSAPPANRGKADLVLGALVRRRGGRDEVTLYIASGLGAPAEVRRAPAAGNDFTAAFQELDRPLVLFDTWAGWTAIDPARGGAPILAAVAPQSPAARAGLQAGDQVRSLDDEPAGDAAGLARLLAAVAPGETVRLSRRSLAGEAGSVTLTPVARLRLLPLDHPGLLYHVAYAQLNNALLGQTDPATARAAALNLGVVMIRFGRAEDALQSFLQPRPGGVPDPITHYLRALALRKLGEGEGARQSLQAVARAGPSELEPENLPVRILAAELLSASGR
jgi:hypothetical protein